MLITGLRGVGKTVLLGAFESRARAAGWITVSAEITKNEDFGPRLGSMVRRALFQVAPKASWTEKIRRAAGVLKSFSVTVASDGSVSAGIDNVAAALQSGFPDARISVHDFGEELGPTLHFRMGLVFFSTLFMDEEDGFLFEAPFQVTAGGPIRDVSLGNRVAGVV